MSQELNNLFSKIPESAPEEEFLTLISGRNFKLERIVSKGHKTPEGQWYDQAHHEWVTLLRGTAGLKIEHRDEIIVLKPGDCINIPAHQRHRVEWTEQDSETIWLAVHYDK